MARAATPAVVPDLPPSAPRFGNAATRAIGRSALRLAGWRITGTIPDVPRVVVIAAPHTCGLDVVLGIAVLLALGVRVHWLAKRETFRWPIRRLLRWLGGVAVDRASPAGAVRQAIERLRSQPQCYLALAPEGTRRKVPQWKSGFHRIATGAGVPVLPVALDYSRREVHVAPLYHPAGAFGADVAELRRHFHAGMARHPERY